MSDFKNVLGNSITTILPRLKKSAATLHSMITGRDTASRSLPLRLQIEITDRCNFNCIMCDRPDLIAQGHKLNNDIPYETFARLIDQIKPYYVTINGRGEPLLHPQLNKIIELCRRRKITTAMPTNMSLARGEKLQMLLNALPDILTVSFHGPHAESFQNITKSDTFDRFSANLDQLLTKTDPKNDRIRNISHKNHKKTTKIRLLSALQAANMNDYQEMFDFLKKRNILNDMCLLPVFDYRGPNAKTVIPTNQKINETNAKLTQLIENTEDTEKKNFFQRWQNTLLQIKPNCQTNQTAPCLIPWFSTYLSASGDVTPCCYLTGKHNIMGNINDQPFEEIWNGQKYRLFRKKMRQKRQNLPDCLLCQRNDSARVRKYKFAALGKSLWPIT